MPQSTPPTAPVTLPAQPPRGKRGTSGPGDAVANLNVTDASLRRIIPENFADSVRAEYNNPLHRKMGR